MGFEIENGVLKKYIKEKGETEVVIPDTVTRIGGNAFWGWSSLTSITIPDSVTCIEWNAFYGCSSLTSIKIPNSVTEIGSSAFGDCSSLTSIKIPDSVTEIGMSVFCGCSSLTSILIPDSVMKIGPSAFCGCSSLTSITIPDSVTSIGYRAFENCSSLASITIPDSVNSIEDGAFNGTKWLEKHPDEFVILNGILIKCKGDKKNVIIPNTVTVIGSSAFYRSTLTSITIPDSVTSIKWNAFKECSSLINITIPDSVTSIGCSVFENCSNLTSITIPDSVISIGEGAFYGTKWLEKHPDEFVILNGILIKYKGDKKNVIIPNTVTRIGDGAFFGCRSLIDVKIPNSVTVIGRSAFYRSSLTSIDIPDSVRIIGYRAFSECNLRSITIPNSVTVIGNSAFDGCCSLTSITIPDSVTVIGDSAFSGCRWLESVTIPSSVTSIGKSAFSDCRRLKSLTIPDTEIKTGEYAFSTCWDLYSVTITKTNANNDDWAFKGWSKIEFPKEENSSFIEEFVCKFLSRDTLTSEFLKKAKCNNSVDPIFLQLCRKGQEDCITYVKRCITRFANNSIDRNSLSELKEYENRNFFTKTNLNKIAEYALGKKKQNNEIILYLLDVKKRLGKYKLEELDRLLEKAQGNVEVTAWLLECKNNTYSQEKIDDHENDRMEKALGFKEYTLTEWKKMYSFESDGKDGYKITGYKGEETDIIIPDEIAKKKVTAIDDYAFSPKKPRLSKNLKAVTEKINSVVIPESVTSIGSCAFYDCSSLTSITIPDSVTSIEQGAFSGCCSLTSITIPDSVTSIGISAFYDCSSLTSITIPDSVTSIGESAFMYCRSLTNISIPNSVTSIDNYAFYGCSSLTSITIPDSVTRIGIRAFEDCRRLKNITIPDSVTSIGESVFGGCSSLKSITIPDSVKSIAGNAFEGCKKIELSCNGLKVICDNESISSQHKILKMISKKDYSVKLDHNIKFPAIVSHYLKSDEAEAEEYINKNYVKIIERLVEMNDVELISELLKTEKFITKKNIDKLIDIALTSKDLEIRTLFLNYKNDHFGDFEVNYKL